MMIFIVSLSTVNNVYAAERKTVRVAFFPMDGYHIVEEDGSYGGMDVEYLKEISNYTAWNIEYVECESWSDALEKLSNKEVDIVGSAQYSEERAQVYSYADLSSGYTFGVIAANRDTDAAYEYRKSFRWSDIPNGYTASSPGNDNGTIAPTAAVASIPYTPEESLKAIRYFYYVLGDKLFKEYGFRDSFNLSQFWFAPSYIAIDQGPIVVMIENYRTQLLWNNFMKNEDVRKGLDKLGFTY